MDKSLGADLANKLMPLGRRVQLNFCTGGRPASAYLALTMPLVEALALGARVLQPRLAWAVSDEGVTSPTQVTWHRLNLHRRVQ